MKYPIPTTKETRKLLSMPRRKSPKYRGRAALEAIKANLEAIAR